MIFGFYNIVLIIAVVILILTLTYVGIQMRNKVKTAVWPPMVAACPDYWEQSSDVVGCIIPKPSQKNSGNVLTSSTTPNNSGKIATPSTSTIPGYYTDANGNQCINFNDPAWKGKGGSTCTKKEWAGKNEIYWDGITNYNQSC